MDDHFMISHEYLLTINTISCTLSIFGSLFIVISYFLFHESQRCGRRFLLSLSIADFGAAGSWLLGTLAQKITLESESIMKEDSTICLIQGFLLQYFQLASYLWTGCFAFHLFSIISQGNKTPEIYEIKYHLLSWGLPLLIDVYFLVQHVSGYHLIGECDRYWCWIRVWNGNEFVVYTATLQFILYYIPIMLILTFNLSLYILLTNKMSLFMSSRLQWRIRIRLFSYLAVFVFCTSWGFLGRLYQVVSPSHQKSAFLLFMEASFTPAQGFLNAIVYGLNKKLKERYVSIFCKDSRFTSSIYNSGNPKTFNEKKPLVVD